MRTVHWNGERWYANTASLAKRIRKWFVWIGGWEKANNAGWEILRRRLDGTLTLNSPTPVSFFGHRMGIHGTGRRMSFDMRTEDGWLVMSRERGYISRDGTPQHAHCWLWGAPHDVEMQIATAAGLRAVH